MFSLTSESVDHSLANIFSYARDGWKYTDADLEETLRLSGLDDPMEIVDGLRELMSAGWQYTHLDFRRDMSGPRLVQLDSDRNTLRTMRQSRWILLLAPALAVAIGMIAGRNWAGRLMWTSGAVALASAVTLALVGPFSETVLGPYLEGTLKNLVFQLFREVALPGTGVLAMDRILGVSDIAVSDVKAGVISTGTLILVSGLAGMAVSAGMYLVKLASRDSE